MKKISGVLFDFDGVLSSLDVRLGWPFYQALKKIKPNITKQEILLSLNDVMKMYLNGEKRDFFYVPKMIFKIAKTLHLGYLQMFRFIIILAILVKKNNNNIFPEEHADDVLKQITTKYRTALITHAEREVIQEAHKKFVNLKDLDLIITQQDIDYAKPHPQGIKKAIQQLG
ncbi:MAG: HAD family hydrolase, partial [Candidatus Thorarchaeota archaeon]